MTFAGGNAMVFETDYTKSNNIMFKINSNISPENQIYFEGHIGIFGIRDLVNVTINNVEFSMNMVGKIFNGNYEFDMDISAPYDESIIHALFTVKAKFPQM